MVDTNVALTENARFHRDDFLNRWKMARVSALRKFVPLDLSEDELLEKIERASHEALLREVFSRSRKFGISASRFLGLTFEISDLREILQKSKIPCFTGDWRNHNQAIVYRRSGCTPFKNTGPLGCDYWREALDGLVMGVGETERFARHQSLGHGDSFCLDILFNEEISRPRIVQAESAPVPLNLKYGPVSPEIFEKFQPLKLKFKQMKIEMLLLGISEGTLHYRLDPERGVLCGASGKIMHDIFSRGARDLLPNIQVKDAAPLAVYGGSA